MNAAPLLPILPATLGMGHALALEKVTALEKVLGHIESGLVLLGAGTKNALVAATASALELRRPWPLVPRALAEVENMWLQTLH
jgi:hypothetical protein